jgi:hypothetical protein
MKMERSKMMATASTLAALCALGFTTSACTSTLPVVDGTEGTGAAGSGTGSSAVSTGASKVVARATATISPFGDGQMMGTAEFEQLQNGTVSGSYKVKTCVSNDDTVYGYIYEGKSCASKDTISGTWGKDSDGTFGPCTSWGEATMLALHIAQPSLPSDWSIGDGSERDLTGHVAVIFYEDKNDKRSGIVGCGVITKVAVK